MKIGVFGDIILDKYILGTTSRISPEAPVPIVHKNEEFSTLGGAANVAANLKKLDNDVELFGAIGNDEDGLLVIKLCSDLGIIAHLFTSPSIPTTTKSRIISRNQQMLRIDHEKMLNSATETAQALQNKVLASLDIIAISDYAKGYISREILDKIFYHKSAHCKVIIDPKGKDWSKYKSAFLVKPNISELEDVLHTSIENKDQAITEAGREIINQYNFSNLLVTRGSEGMTLINKNEAIHFPTKKVDVFDVSGAGDTSLAALIDSISKGSSLHRAIEIANIASSYVVTKSMTYALSRAELDNLISLQ